MRMFCNQESGPRRREGLLTALPSHHGLTRRGTERTESTLSGSVHANFRRIEDLDIVFIVIIIMLHSSHLLLHLPDNLLHVDRVGEEGSQEHLRGTNTLLRLLLGSLGEQTAAETVEGVCCVEMVVHVRKQRRRASMVNASPHTHIT